MGKVYLVGAGPGKADLITLRGLELIRTADIILYDELIDRELFSYARKDCVIEPAGKRAGMHRMSQDEINRLIIDSARNYSTVVRLKGGDPLIFGRGGEEAMALSEEGIDYEIVPGVTSASAVPARAGIPLTHRGIARSFHVITGHTKDDELDYSCYSDTEGTLVFLMGLNKLGKITEDLLKGGIDPCTPAAVISEGFSDNERIVRGTVSDVAKISKREGIVAPAIIVVGKTAGMDLRARAVYLVGSSSFRERFQQAAAERGLNTRSLINIRTEITEKGKAALQEALHHLSDYGWIVFASRNGFRLFLQVSDEAGIERKQLDTLKIAAIGNGTASAIIAEGLHVDLVPFEYTSMHLAEDLTERADDKRLLIIRAEAGSEDMYPVLDDDGAKYDVVTLYRSYGELIDKERIPGRGDLVALASASGVRAFFELFRDAYAGNTNIPEFACIGDSTAGELRKNGLEPLIISKVHSAEGLATELAAK